MNDPYNRADKEKPGQPLMGKLWVSWLSPDLIRGSVPAIPTL
jgi:hypothetical protein